jgi:hypothetical protein
MIRRFFKLFSAAYKTSSGNRSAVARKRKLPCRLGLDELETRLVPSTLPLRVVGNQLQDSLGHTVVLRGVNVNSLEYNPTGNNVLQAESIAINDWHANLIRLPVNQDYWFGHNEWWSGNEAGDGGAAYRALVDQLITTAQAHNVYIMLDLHWSDMGRFSVGNDGQHFLPDDNSTRFWQSAATIYANNPAVLFDPYNEPNLGVWHPDGGYWDWTPTDADFALWQNGGTVVEGDVNDGHTIGTYHSPGMQGLINTIRATGATNIVAPEGLNWGSDLTGVTTGHALSDPTGNLMYQAHLYPDKDRSSAVAVAANHPIYVGEWGDGGVVGHPSADATTSNQNMLAFLNAHNFSWTAWDLAPDAGSDLNLLTAWNANSTTPDFGALVKADLAQHVVQQGGNGPAFAFADTDDWGTGFVGQITITNTGNTPINGWKLGFDFTGAIDPTPDTGIWDAQVVSHVGNHYVIQNVGWDATIDPGQSVSFGFVATWGDPHAAPSNFALIQTVAAPTVATAAHASANPVTAKTTSLSVLGADAAGEPNLTYTWTTTGTPPAAVTFSTNGTNAAKNTTATFSKAGTYSFLVTIKNAGGLTTTSSVSVTVNQALTTISVRSAQSGSMATGATRQFMAATLDQFGIAMATQPGFTWSVVGGGAITATGLYTAPAHGGSVTIRASAAGKSGSAQVKVISATVGFQDTDDWGTGFVGQITVTNTGNSAINGWTLEFDFAGTIDATPDTGIWDAQVISHVGNHYVIRNVSWDASIAAGQSVTFGFVADWDAAHTAPSHYLLNGLPVQQV